MTIERLKKIWYNIIIKEMIAINKLGKIMIISSLSVLFLFTCIGYAQLTDFLSIIGNVNITPTMEDVYITDVNPSSTTSITVNSTQGTILFATVNNSGSSTFTIDVINISNKTYVFERVIDGAEFGFEGAYSGTDITYQLSNIAPLDEIAPNGGTLTFKITINVPKGISADQYILKFNFIEKTGTEILPGNDEYDVTFHYNNGQPSKLMKIRSGELIPRQETPVKDGYIFTGWYTDNTFTQPWNFEVDKVSNHMNLYAKWEDIAPENYIVTLKPGNGDSNTIIAVPANSLIPIPATPVLENYTFIGWYTDEACTNAWNFDIDKVNSNMTLYGGWEIYVPPVPPECYITFKPNNGDPDNTIIVMTGDFIPRPTTPILANHVFSGWYIDETFTTAWNFEVDRVEGNMTLYGKWDLQHIIEAVTYVITFNANNNTTNTSVSVEEGSLIPIPQTPVKDGYTFIGWYTDSSCTNAWNFDIDKPTSNMTLYGGWEEKSDTDPDDSLHTDFLGLVEALLSTSNNCLNNNDIIFDAVMESLTSKKRPKEDAPILHCGVNSISGGTMSAVAEFANSNLTSELHFIFEVDPDPAYQNTRLRLYMYYESDIDNANIGDSILVYKQIISRGSDGVWFADGTYIGSATVGDYFGGGSAGKDVTTISPYTWVSNAKTTEE